MDAKKKKTPLVKIPPGVNLGKNPNKPRGRQQAICLCGNPLRDAHMVGQITNGGLIRSFFMEALLEKAIVSEICRDFAFKKKLAYFSKLWLCTSLIPSKGLLISVAMSHILQLALIRFVFSYSWLTVTAIVTSSPTYFYATSTVEDHCETKGKVSRAGFLCKGVSRMSPCGLTGLLLAPWWARLQHYASLTGSLLLSIIVLSQTHTHTHTRSRNAHTHWAFMQTCTHELVWTAQTG